MAEVRSGSVTSNSYDGKSVTFHWELTGQSIANNTSTISWTLKGSGTSSFWHYSGPFNLTIDGNKVVDNKYPSGSRIQLSVGTLVASGTATISHDSKGSKSFSVSFDAAIYENSTNCYGSDTFTLPTIPRASNFGKISGSTIGSAITINIDRKVDTFTHKVYYSFGSIEKTAINTSAGSSCSWTPSLSDLGAQIPNDTSGVCTLYLETYNGSTKIGDTVTKQITLSMPASAVPSISSIAVSEANSTVNSVCPGIFLQSLSKLKIKTTAAGVYGSSVVKCEVTFESVKYSGSDIETNVVKGSGSLTITVIVTDSRGRTTTKTQDVTITAYTEPKLTSATIRRNETTPTTINCIVSGSVCSIKSGSAEKNTCTVYVLYSTTTSYPAISDTYRVTTSGLSFSNASKSYTGINAIYSYYFKVIVRDKFNEFYQEYKISTAAVILHIHEDGYLGIGKYREKGALDVSGDIYSNGTLVSLSGHEHSVDQITDFPESLKNPFSLIIKSDIQQIGTYDGSAQKTLIITPSSIGAVASEDSGWKSLNSYIRYRKVNGIVYVNGKSTGGMSINSNYVTVGTLPSGYRPLIQTEFVYHQVGGVDSGRSAYVEVGGAIKMYNKETTGYWGFSLSFPV